MVHGAVPAPRVLHVVSELFPIVKTGGLADVAAALPVAQRAEGVDARLLVPGYPQVMAAARSASIVWSDPDLFRGGAARLLSAHLGESTVPSFVLDCPGLYQRAGGPYQDAHGADYPDNHRRFAALGWVAATLARSAAPELGADVLHTHDWQAGLAPAYLSVGRRPRPRVVSTIHSIAYPGSFDASVLGELGLPASMYAVDGVEFFGRVSFLKAALNYADKITTVSPTYAREIQMDGLGGGFEGLLRHRARDFVGILNGVDYEEWDPASDVHLPAHYTVEAPGPKAVVRAALQRRVGLEVDHSALLLGVVSRLVWQKGIDWVVELAPEMVERGAQLVVLGSGDPAIALGLEELSRRYPGRVATVVGHDENLARWVLAGSDSILVPSRTEPCGLTQLYALRYGSPPIVRRTGGLADTVVDAGEGAAPGGTGFVFDSASADGLRDAVARALSAHAHPEIWGRVRGAAMRADFGWRRSALAYAELYRGLLASGPVLP